MTSNVHEEEVKESASVWSGSPSQRENTLLERKHLRKHHGDARDTGSASTTSVSEESSNEEEEEEEKELTPLWLRHADHMEVCKDEIVR